MKELVMNNIPQILVGIVILVIGFFIVQQIRWHMRFEYKYSQEIITKGKVIYKDYVPSKTESYYGMGFDGKMKWKTRYVSAKYYVKFTSADLGDEKYNDKELYDEVSDGQEIKVVYVKRYVVDKERPSMTRNYDKNIIKAIINIKGQRIDL